jgi:hypothetical protein
MQNRGASGASNVTQPKSSNDTPKKLSFRLQSQDESERLSLMDLARVFAVAALKSEGETPGKMSNVLQVNEAA